MFNMLWANRRDLLTAPLLATMPAGFWGDRAKASPIDQNMTSTILPDQIVWQAALTGQPKTVEQAPLWGKSSEPGLYYTLVKWYPGFMSAPHWYETDRLCVVVSGPGGWRVGKTSSRTTRFRCRRAASSGALRGRRITTASRRTVTSLQ
jgi:hypothetical protein